MAADISNLYWFKPKPIGGIIPRPPNLGDALSPVIVSAVLAERAPGAVRPANGRRLLAIGSVLNHAERQSVLWGTGFNSKKAASAYTFSDLDPRAVRGPRTRAFLAGFGVEAPDVYGDPGLLISRYYPRSRAADREYVVVPHYNEKAGKFGRHPTLSTRGADMRRFVDGICRSRLVISSSLHGLIIAEAYGVPAVLLFSGNGEELEKYRDYYEGTGRAEFPVATTVAEARAVTPAPVPDVEAVQTRLLDAFPFDLWAGS